MTSQITRVFKSLGSRNFITKACTRIIFNADCLLETANTKLHAELEELIADGLVEEVTGEVTAPIIPAAPTVQSAVTGIINTQKASVSTAPSNTGTAATPTK
jgi:hypothetical protein